MKKIVLTLSVILIVSAAWSQNTNTKNNFTGKEKMKMQVTHVVANGINYRSATGSTSSLTPKEAMNAAITRRSSSVVNITITTNRMGCAACESLARLGTKERMKARVAGLFKCDPANVMAGHSGAKCHYCGIRMITKM